MDRGFLACDTDADLVTIPVLTQKPHNAVETCQVPREGPEPRAVNCVLESLDTCGLGEVLLKEDAGFAIQTLVDASWLGRGERTMVEKSSKYSHQSSGAAENATRKIENSSKTCDCVSHEKHGCRGDSESVVPPWAVRRVAHVLSQSDKCDDDHSVRVRLRSKECDSRWPSGSQACVQ